MTPDPESPKSNTTWGDQSNEHQKFRDLADGIDDEVVDKDPTADRDDEMVPVSLSEDDRVHSTPGKSARDVDSIGEHPSMTVDDDDSAPYSDYTSNSDGVHGEPTFNRKPLPADGYLLNRVSKTIVREQVAPGTQSSSSANVVPAAKAKPILAPGVKAYAKSKSSPIVVQCVRTKNCPTPKSSP